MIVALLDAEGVVLLYTKTRSDEGGENVHYTSLTTAGESLLL